MPLSPGTRLGSYEVLALIGKGGMGEVYRARDTALKREVALKVLPVDFSSNQERMARFQREAEVLASLDHPNIGHIYGIVESNGSRALVLALIEGLTLEDRIAAGPISIEEAMAIATQIAEALEYAHERGVIHRDLKPANIKINSDGVVKVLDFGLAKVLEDEPPAGVMENSPTLTLGHTRVGVILGTAAYMSPEQAVGRPVDRRSDIFSFGAALYEMLTGKRAFAGETTPDVLEAVVKNDPDWSKLPAGTPTAIRQLLRRCVAKDRKQRLQAIGEARIVLASPMVEAATPVAAPLRSRIKMSGWIVAAVLASALVIALWTSWRMEPDKPLMRLEVDLGADVVLPLLNANASSIVISPDGTRLVYATASGALPGSRFLGGGGGRGRLLNNGPLFIRRLNEDKAVALPGTEGAVTISFSPDSQWIAFSVGRGAMSKISVDGGAVVPLAMGSLLDWAEDGSILFRAATGMMQIPAGGGEPVTVPGDAAPRMLPGGKAALRTRSGAGRGGMGTDTVSIEAVFTADGKTEVLVPGASSPRYLPTGHLLYVSKGTLFAVPFDPDKLETRGTAVAIVNDVQFNTFTGSTDISVSRNGTLVYRKGGASGFFPKTPSAMEWIDALGRRSPVTAKTGAYIRPRLSPDGSQVALLISEPDSRNEWVYDLRRDSLTKVTFGEPPAISTPAWSPDGRYLFVGSGNGDASGIYLVRADGATQHPERLLQTQAVVFPQSYSKQVKRLTYYGLGRFGILTAPLAEENGQWKVGMPEHFLPGSQFTNQTPVFSRDGRWLAYATDESGQSEVNVRPVSGLSRKWKVSTDGGSNPRWWRNELLYQSSDQIMSVSYTVSGETFSPDKPRVRVDKIGSTEWDVAPDGRILVLTPMDAPEAPPAEHTVVFLLNFFDALRRKVPVGK